MRGYRIEFHGRAPYVILSASVAICGIIVFNYPRLKRFVRSIRVSECDLPMGLPNPRNLCYLNALLQAMSTNASLVRFMKRSARVRRNRLLYCLVCLLQGLRCSVQYITVNNLESVLQNVHNLLLFELTHTYNWSADDQQDAHELFSFFMDVASCRELGRTAAKASEGLTLASRFFGPRYEQMVPRSFHRNHMNAIPNAYTIHSPLRTEVFQHHLVANQVTCSSCDYRSSPVLQPEACLTVFFDASAAPHPVVSKVRRAESAPSTNPRTLGRQNNPTTSVIKLSECLSKQFGTHEPLPDLPCPKCQTGQKMNSIDSAVVTANSAIQPKGLCQQERWLAHLPPCLVLHVQRSAWFGRSGVGWKPFGFGSKRSDHLGFPYRLNMTNYMLASRSRMNSGGSTHRRASGDQALSNTLQWPIRRSHSYVLRSVLVHQGESINAGHYVSYRAWRKPDLSKQKQDAPIVRCMRYLIRSVRNFFHGISNRLIHASSAWVLTSDAYVMRVSSDEVRSSLAYLLFYEREAPASRWNQLITDDSSHSHRRSPSDVGGVTLSERSRVPSSMEDTLEWEQGGDPHEEGNLVNALDETDDDDDEDGDNLGLHFDDIVEESDEPSETGADQFTSCSKADSIRTLALAASSCP